MRVACRVVFLMLMVWALPASADDPKATATRMFKEGRAAVTAGDYQKGLSLFTESQRLDPSPGALLNLARCEEELGMLEPALKHYRDSLDQLRPQDDRRPLAEEGIARIEKRGPKLRITLAPTAPPGTVVALDGVAVADLGAEKPLAAGPHTVVVTAPGRPPRRYDLAPAQGVQELSVEPGVAAGPPPSNAPLWPWIAVGGGAVAGGVAIALAIDYAHVQSTISRDCPAPNASGQLVCDASKYTLDDAHALAGRRDRDGGLSLALGIAGGAALAVGTYGLLSRRSPAASSVSVGVFAAPSGSGLAASGRF